jgi:hypothetical protein
MQKVQITTKGRQLAKENISLEHLNMQSLLWMFNIQNVITNHFYLNQIFKNGNILYNPKTLVVFICIKISCIVYTQTWIQVFLIQVFLNGDLDAKLVSCIPGLR